MVKANWRYGKENAPRLLRNFDRLIERNNGKRDWYFIFTGILFLFFSILSQDYISSISSALLLSWVAPWIIRIRRSGFRRGTRYWWGDLMRFDTVKWAGAVKKQIMKFIHNSFVACWFRTWPKFFQELFWSSIFVAIGVGLFQVYKDYPMDDERVIALIRELQKYIPIPDNLGNAVYMGGFFIGLGILRISWYLGRWLLKKINLPVKIVINITS